MSTPELVPVEVAIATLVHTLLCPECGKRVTDHRSTMPCNVAADAQLIQSIKDALDESLAQKAIDAAFTAPVERTAYLAGAKMGYETAVGKFFIAASADPERLLEHMGVNPFNALD